MSVTTHNVPLRMQDRHHFCSPSPILGQVIIGEHYNQIGIRRL